MNLRHPFLFLAALAIATPGFAGWGNAHREAFSFAGDFSAEGTIRIENTNGSITVEAWDRDAYAIEGEKRAANEADLERIAIDWDLTADHIAVKVQLPKKAGWLNRGTIDGGVDFVLKVPATVRVEELRTVNGGIVLTGMRGPVNAETVNGGIKARDLGGDARLHTVNGGLVATFSHVAPTAKLELETVNGGVKVTLPAATDAEIHGSVVNGRIHSDLPLTVKGEISKRSLRATLGDGGARIRAATVNGSVHFASVDA